LGSRKPESSEGIRLNRYLARCGWGSRRFCDELIRQGRVSVNGRPGVAGMRVVPGRDEVRVDGRVIRPEPLRYYLFYKPTGVICTVKDPAGRRCVGDYIRTTGLRLFPVGRLDRDSEGLLLLTNDGELADRLLHPRHGVERTYLVWVDRELSGRECRRMQRGLICDGERLRAERVESVGRERDCWMYRVVLREGRNRQIRRMMRQVGAGVCRLRRVAYGALAAPDLRPGELREVSRREVERLFSSPA